MSVCKQENNTHEKIKLNKICLHLRLAYSTMLTEGCMKQEEKISKFPQTHSSAVTHKN